jgi:capsular polysaccharide biosynthesis protein
MAMIGVALGIGLGIAVAFLIEMLDRRIRSRDDLIEAVPFPLLGVIERAKKRPRLTFWQRTPALALK